MAPPVITVPSWIQHSELIVAENSPLGLADITNRPAKTVYNDLVSHHNANEGVHGIAAGSYVAKTSRSDQQIPTTDLVGPHTFSSAVIINADLSVNSTNGVVFTQTSPPQLRVRYNSTTYIDFIIASNGSVIIDVAGSAPTLTFNDPVVFAAGSSYSGTTAFTNAVTVTVTNELPLTLTQSLTGANAYSGLYIVPTWNTSGVVTAVLVSVTDTASNAGSLLLDMLVGATSRFKITKTGLVTINPNGGPGLTLNTIASAQGLLIAMANGGTNAIQVSGGTQTTSNDGSILNLAQTWNGSGQTFCAIKMNITNTLSDSNSELIDLQASGNSRFRVLVGGTFEIGTATVNIIGGSSDITFNGGALCSVQLGGGAQVGNGFYGLSGEVDEVAYGLTNRDTGMYGDAAQVAFSVAASRQGGFIDAGIFEVGESASLARFRLKGFFGASPSDPPQNETDMIVVDTGAAQFLRVRYNDGGSMKVGDLALV